jgi:hypothetical protein
MVPLPKLEISFLKITVHVVTTTVAIEKIETKVYCAPMISYSLHGVRGLRTNEFDYACKEEG